MENEYNTKHRHLSEAINLVEKLISGLSNLIKQPLTVYNYGPEIIKINLNTDKVTSKIVESEIINFFRNNNSVKPGSAMGAGSSVYRSNDFYIQIQQSGRLFVITLSLRD